MLKNLEIGKRMQVCALKASLACTERELALMEYSVSVFRSSLRDLIREEPAFLLLDQNMFEEVLTYCAETGDEKNYQRLVTLDQNSLTVKNKMIENYLNRDSFQRGTTYSLREYQEMLETDDDLLKELDSDYFFDRRYLLNSIRYLKLIFSDYYMINKKANQYLQEVCEDTLEWGFIDPFVEQSMRNLFQKGQKAKIYTFPKNRIMKKS